MSKKERIEDLGKLSILLRNLFDDELFDLHWRRPKDAWEVFSSVNDDQKEELISSLAYGLERIIVKIANCMQIAVGDNED